MVELPYHLLNEDIQLKMLAPIMHNVLIQEVNVFSRLFLINFASMGFYK